MPSENYILLERTELNASAASVSFLNIPQTGYTDLKIVISARNSAGGTSEGIFLQMNSVATGYSNRVLFGNGSTAASGNNSYGITSKTYIGEIPTSGSTASTFGNIEVYIPNYTSSNQKSISSDAVTENNSTAVITALNASLVTSTAAITSLTFTPFSSDFAANSTFSLYGIAALGTTPVIAPKASGGNIIATDGTYWYHAFLSSGAFVPQVGLSCDVLVVAGGGGGSGWDFAGGGGGAGGLQAFASQSISTSQPITVGAGGAGTTANYNPGTDGSNSVFGSLTASVGGGGGGASNAGNSTGRTGGSGGGGGAGGTALGGSASPSGQGNAGGNGFSAGQKYPGGGGGGAGGAGANTPNSASGGAGGIGLNTKTGWGTFSAMVSATGLGASGYFAGGGGGGVYAEYGGGAVIGAGGTGGGGNGGVGNGPSVVVSNGVVNTGGGGGGAGAGQNGGNGGAGVVIIRYPIA